MPGKLEQQLLFDFDIEPLFSMFVESQSLNTPH